MNKDKKYVIAPILISLCAVLLSQIKPIYTYFENPKIDILVGKNVNFYESWGNLGANLFIQLVNTGGESGTLEKIDVFITSKDSEYVSILHGQSYYLQPESVGQNEIVSQIPFSYVTVKNNSIWTGYINAYANFSKSQQKKIQDFTQAVDEDLISKWKPDGPIVTIEDELLEEIINFTRGNLKDFDIGEHQILVMAWMQGEPDPAIKKAYTYSVYETDKKRLLRKEQEYPMGYGIIFPIPQAKIQFMNFNSTLTEISDEKIAARLYSAYQKESL